LTDELIVTQVSFINLDPYQWIERLHSVLYKATGDPAISLSIVMQFGASMEDEKKLHPG